MFSFQYKIKENETINQFTEEDAEIIALNFIEYIKDDRIFNFPIAILYQIISKFYQNNALSDEDEKAFVDFLFKCLDKYKSEASVLFTFLDFNKDQNKIIERLSIHYLNLFDFNMIGSKLIKYALQTEKKILYYNKNSHFLFWKSQIV